MQLPCCRLDCAHGKSGQLSVEPKCVTIRHSIVLSSSATIAVYELIGHPILKLMEVFWNAGACSVDMRTYIGKFCEGDQLLMNIFYYRAYHSNGEEPLLLPHGFVNSSSGLDFESDSQKLVTWDLYLLAVCYQHPIYQISLVMVNIVCVPCMIDKCIWDGMMGMFVGFKEGLRLVSSPCSSKTSHYG